MSICFGMNLHLLQYFVCASSVRSGVTAESSKPTLIAYAMSSKTELARCLFCIGTCSPMTIPMCEPLDYNSTRMPNMFGHVTVEDAGLEIHQFFPLVQV